MFEINYWILVSSSQYYQSKGQIFFSIFHLNLFIYLFWGYLKSAFCADPFVLNESIFYRTLLYRFPHYNFQIFLFFFSLILTFSGLFLSSLSSEIQPEKNTTCSI